MHPRTFLRRMQSAHWQIPRRSSPPCDSVPYRPPSEKDIASDMNTIDPNTPAARMALQHACGLCHAHHGEVEYQTRTPHRNSCRTSQPGQIHWYRTVEVTS